MAIEYFISTMCVKLLNIPSNGAIHDSWNWFYDMMLMIHENPYLLTNSNSLISSSPSSLENIDLSIYSNFLNSESSLYNPKYEEILIKSLNRNDKCAILNSSNIDANNKDTLLRSLTKVLAPYVLNTTGASI